MRAAAGTTRILTIRQSGFDEVQGGSGMIWARMLAYITGTVDQELLPRNFSVSQFVMQRPVPWERVGSPTVWLAA